MSASIAVLINGMRDARQINSHLAPLLKVKESHLREALAAAAGYRTNESLIADSSDRSFIRDSLFDYEEFAKRLGELTSVSGTAEAITALLEGAGIKLQIIKHPYDVYGRYLHVQYGIRLEVTTPDGAPAEHSFVLPEFSSDSGEPYRIDNWHSHRHYPASSDKPSYRPLTNVGAFVDGVWNGELFVYGHVHQMSDESCIRRVTAALARAVLRELSGGIYCNISRPQGYEYGAWRIEISVCKSAQMFLFDSELVFNRPELKSRIIIADDGYRAGGANVLKLVAGKCRAHVYSNGVHEDSNPTSVTEVRLALVSGVRDSLRTTGWKHRAEWRLGD